jgi:thioredoxin 1
MEDEQEMAGLTAEAWDREVLESETLVAVDFWHENCIWCSRLDPLLEEMARDYGGRVKFAKLHVFEENDIARRYGIMSTPTVKFFCRGQELAEIVGFRDREALRQEIDGVLERYEDCLSSATALEG